MVRDGIDVGQGLRDARKLFGREFNPSVLKSGQEETDQFVTVNPGFDVHDAVQATHFAEETVKVDRRPLLRNIIKL